ncbi:MAG: hypothetical protein M3296_04930 [Actinomycetota bacterium]|nr:hypothetical protein [Actinomycetota bacterium]
MPIKLQGRYEPGSAKERAHRLLTGAEVKVDHVWGVDELQEGMEAITFTFDGKAHTAFVTDGSLLRVVDGWDVPPPATDVWRGQA